MIFINKQTAKRILVISLISVVLCIIGLVVVFLNRDKISEREHKDSVSEEPQSVSVSFVEDEDTNPDSDKASGDETDALDDEENSQYIINDIGYDVYIQLTGDQYPDDDCDTSEVDRVIERYYRRQNLVPQPLPGKTTTEE